jgi:hypothetical protein
MARLQKKTQAAVTTGSAENTRHSPRDGLTAYFALSPGTGVLAPVCDNALSRIALTSAPGDQDHTTWPCVSSCSSAWTTTLQPDTPTASHLNTRDDRGAPLS